MGLERLICTHWVKFIKLGSPKIVFGHFVGLEKAMINEGKSRVELGWKLFPDQVKKLEQIHAKAKGVPYQNICERPKKHEKGGGGIKIKRDRNKVIRPKSRASALSKNVRQTDKSSFSKALFKRLFTPPSFFSAIQSHQKRDKKP